VNKRISRRQFLTFLAVSAGGAGLLMAHRFLTTQAVKDSDLSLSSKIHFPSMSRQPDIYTTIRHEALAPNSAISHPLPFVGSWNASTWWNYNTSDAGFDPGWQLDMVAQGHHLLPWFNMPDPSIKCQPDEICEYADYHESALKRAAQMGLPISFVSTQWEEHLYEDPDFYSLPIDQNPNVISLNGTVQKKISPFGPLICWYKVGKKWGSSPMMKQIIEWYPSPPLVIFISNNEADKLYWVDAEVDQRYINLYGYGHEDEFKRRVFANAWIEHYRILIKGFQDGFENSTWQKKSKFIAYQAFGPGWFGSWDGWKEYSLYVKNRIDPNPLYWQGGSPSLYICPSCKEQDNNVRGGIFQSMNWVFILNEALRLNPSYWFEFSSWDGDLEAQDLYADLGQSLTPERYGGFVQYGMWLIKPRVVRMYRDWDQSRKEILPWLLPVLNAVDKVYLNPILQSFWRNSTLIPNPSRKHPYQSSIPTEYDSVDRMFLLTTNLDPPLPWSEDTEFPVMSLARVKGNSPNKQWLLYAYAPLGSKKNVHIAIPGFGTIIVDVALGGSFYLIDEAFRIPELVLDIETSIIQ
jgi:hypothetical protein